MNGGVLCLSTIQNIATNDASSISFMATLMPLLLFLIFVGGYILVWKMKKTGVAQFRGQYMRFIERIPLGWDRTILIFEVQGFYYIAYVDKNGMRIIDKRDDILEIDMTNKSAFKSILSKFNVDRKSE